MKTITIRDETYRSLTDLKEKDDSFSDVIDRLVRKKVTNIRDYAGALKDSRLIDDLAAFTLDVRKSGRARL